MSVTVTIVLDDEIVKTIHSIQTKTLIKSNESISFSRVINNELRKNIK